MDLGLTCSMEASFLTLLLRRGLGELLWPGWPRSPLVRVGLALLAHVVGSGLTEMEPPHGHLCDLLRGKIDPTENTQGAQEQKRRLPGAMLQSSRRQRALWVAGLAPRHHPTGPETHVTGLKGLLLLSDCDCSMLIDWFRASSWRGMSRGLLRTRFPT